MGSVARVVVAGDPSLVDLAARRLGELEDRWTRFRPSELTELNHRTGQAVPVSRDLYVLVERAVASWRATRGRFDPTVHDALLASGYDRSFPLVGGSVALDRAPARPTPGCRGIALDPARRTIRIPNDVHLDPGGIGKGLAADLVSGELMRAGAEGVLLGVGGDVRVRGHAPGGRSWVVSVADPADADHELARVALADGAIATSSRLKRAWSSESGERLHHVIDPRTGLPCQDAPAGISVIAGEAWWAEAMTTSAMVAGPRWRSALIPADTPAVVVDEDGAVEATESMRRVLR